MDNELIYSSNIKKEYVAPQMNVYLFNIVDTVLSPSCSDGHDDNIESGGDIGWGEEDD